MEQEQRGTGPLPIATHFGQAFLNKEPLEMPLQCQQESLYMAIKPFYICK